MLRVQARSATTPRRTSRMPLKLATALLVCIATAFISLTAGSHAYKFRALRGQTRPHSELANLSDVGGCVSVLSNVVQGTNKGHICAYLHTLLPSKLRFPEPHEAVVQQTFQLEAGIFVPICMIVKKALFRAHRTKAVKIHNTTIDDEVGVPSLRAIGDELLLTVWFTQKRKKNPVQVVMQATDLSSYTEELSRLPEIKLPRNLLPEHFWPAGDFIQHQGLAFAATHQHYYGVGIFRGAHINTLQKLNTTGFENFGGENLGSLFEHDKRLYLSGRVNIRRHIHGMSGHGYRYVGIYRVHLGGQSAKGELIVQHSDDMKCCESCGGCIEDMDFGRCTVDADAWWACSPRPPNATGLVLHRWSVTHPRKPCVGVATHDSISCAHFRSYVECIHKCRAANEIYQTAVSTLHGSLVAIYGSRADNSVYLCHLSQYSLKYSCSDTPFFHSNFSASHPLFSSLVGTKRYIVVAEPVRRELRKVDEDPLIVMKFWEREKFCFLRGRRSIQDIHVTVRSETRLFGIVFEIGEELEEKNLASACASNRSAVTLYMVEPDGVHTIQRKFDRFTRSGTCHHFFVLPTKCLNACHLKVQFVGVNLLGITSVHTLSPISIAEDPGALLRE